MNVTLIADIIGLTLAVAFLLLFLISKNRSNRAKYILVAGMAIAVLLVSLNILVIINEFPLSSFLFLIALPAVFTLYPIVNSYINSFVTQGSKIIINPWDFTLPWFVLLSILLVYIIIDEGSFRFFVTSFYAFTYNLPPVYDVYVFGIYGVYYMQFFYFVNRFINVFKKLKNDREYSFASRWIMYIIIGSFAYEFLFISAFVLSDNILFIDAILSDAAILLFGIVGSKHDEILLELRLRSVFEKKSSDENFRKIKSKLDSHLQGEIVDKIKSIIVDEKLYQNPNLQIKNFAKRLHIPEKELSIIVNENFGKNFSSFVNEYRIEKACELLINHELKISDIPARVGFYSRSSFNLAFKEITGKTPTEFRSNV